jgi:hypothetical protein
MKAAAKAAIGCMVKVARFLAFAAVTRSDACDQYETNEQQ